MTHELITNRFNQTTPTHIQSNGCSVSTPVYVTPTGDQLKAVLNAFRNVVHQQRLDMGFKPPATAANGISVTTAVKPGNTPAEDAIGMTEEALRYALFQRKGLPDRLIFKLQENTGVELVTREAVLATLQTWLDHMNLISTDENKAPKRTNKTSQKRAKSASVSA